MMTHSIQIDELKRSLPLPRLMNRAGFEAFAKRSCRSPFREDKNSSWGIFEKGGRWFFKDFGTGDTGDEVTFLARHLKLDPHRDFKSILTEYARLAGWSDTCSQEGHAPPPKPKPDLSGFAKGSMAQMLALSRRRGIGLAGIHSASERGFLLFGPVEGHECWALTDATRRMVEARRMDQGLFANGQKCKALPNSQKRPLGLIESKPYPRICLAEGGPDFLECWHLVFWEVRRESVAVVTMLGSGNNFNDEDLPYFKGKEVRIFAHADAAGVLAAERWQHQLLSGGARTVDLFDFAPYHCKDLLESSSVIPTIERMLP